MDSVLVCNFCMHSLLRRNIMILIFLLFIIEIYGRFDILSNTTDILSEFKYKTEVYDITTEDGYILKFIHLFANSSFPLNQSVVMIPGLICSSDQFVTGRQNSPAFFLSNKGYDVWLLNLRGTRYSKGHINKSISEEQYWNFTFEKKGIHDVVSAVNFVKNKMNVPKVHLISYSMGGTTLLSSVILIPKFYEENIYSIVNWAPAVKFDHFRSIGLFLLTKFYSFGTLRELGFHEIFKFNFAQSLFLSLLGKFSPAISNFLLSITCDGSTKGYNYEGAIEFVNHYPDSDGIKTFEHLWMGIIDRGFYRYDYTYSHILIPYNFSNAANIPILNMHGEEDLFIVPEDALWTYNKFKEAEKNIFINFYPYMGHISIVSPCDECKVFLEDSHKFLQESYYRS